MEFAPYDELARLVSRAQNGDDGAFAALHGKTSPILRMTIANKVGYAEADDILQEVYLVAWRNLDAIDPQSVVAYLNVTARNLCSNHLRQRQKLGGSAGNVADDEAVSPDRLVASGASGGENPADAAARCDVHRRLREAMMAELDDQERTALLLRYYLGLTNEKTAAQLGVSERTVKRIVARALSTLRHKLGAVPIGADIAAAAAVVHGAQAGGSGATASFGPSRPTTAIADSAEPHQHGADAFSEHGHRIAAAAAALAVAAIGAAAALLPPAAADLPDEPAPAAAAPTYEPPVCQATWTEGGLAWACIRPGSSPIARVWCTGADGTAYESQRQEEGDGTASYAFQLPSGAYTLHVADAAGEETIGPLKVTLYPEP